MGGGGVKEACHPVTLLLNTSQAYVLTVAFSSHLGHFDLVS